MPQNVGSILFERGLFNLEKTMVFPKKLEYKEKKLKYMQPRIRIKTEFPVGK